jgi:hypothetical protein
MKAVTLFSLETGLFKRVIGVPEHALERNVPEGFGYVDGALDPLSQRVDVAAMLLAAPGDHSAPSDFVVDYQPPKPDDDHEWRENAVNGRPRWVKKPEVVARERRAAAAQRDIERLELAQHRPLRELTLDPQNATAKQRMQEIEDAIAAKRLELKG